MRWKPAFSTRKYSITCIWEIPELTPEQVADRALAYKPIILPDESGR